MHILKADTQVKVRVGPFVDSTDGVTPETGVTLGADDRAELLKHDGAATVDISGNTWAAITGCGGWYDLTLTTGNTDTEGLLTVVVQDSSVCLPVFAYFMVVNANIYDSLYAAATDYLQVDTIQISGDGTAADNAELDYDGTGYAKSNGSIGSVSGAVGSVTGAVGSVTGNVGGNVTGSIGSLAVQAKADVNAEVDTALSDYDPPTKAELDTAHSTTNGLVTTVDTVVDAIKAKTDNLPADPASETNVNANETKLDALDTVADAIKVVTDRVADTLEDDGGVYRFTTNALEQAPAGGGGGDATAANQTTIITHLTDVKDTGFVKDTNSLVNVTGASPVNIDHDSTTIVNE